MLSFKEVLGLKIKLGKSELVPAGLVLEVEELAIILGFRRIIANSRFKYREIWNLVLEKMEKRLAN